MNNDGDYYFIYFLFFFLAIAVQNCSFRSETLPVTCITATGNIITIQEVCHKITIEITFLAHHSFLSSCSPIPASSKSTELKPFILTLNIWPSKGLPNQSVASFHDSLWFQSWHFLLSHHVSVKYLLLYIVYDFIFLNVIKHSVEQDRTDLKTIFFKNCFKKSEVNCLVISVHHSPFFFLWCWE